MMYLFRTLHPDETPTSFRRDAYPEPSPNPFFKLLLGIAVMTTILVMATRPFIEWDESGDPHLATWRQKKLAKELSDLENAEQYALKAGVNGWYPCHSCTDTTYIYLHIGEIWKYGSTTKGQKGRYGNTLKNLSLRYEVQFEGTLEACLAEEKRKIYGYALLPENLARQKPLIRPPGNKKDS